MSRPRSRTLGRIFRICRLPSTWYCFLWLKCRGIARGASGAAAPDGEVGGEMSISSGTFNCSAANEFQIIKPKK
jgi:hypothetical protein